MGVGSIGQRRAGLAWGFCATFLLLGFLSGFVSETAFSICPEGSQHPEVRTPSKSNGRRARPPLTAGERELLKEILQETSILRRVNRIAAYWAGRSTDRTMDDFVQIGLEAVMYSLRDFDHSRGIWFSTYAMERASKAMLDAFRVRSAKRQRIEVSIEDAPENSETILANLGVSERPRWKHDDGSVSRLVRELMDTLEPLEQHVVFLRYWESKSVAQISSHLGYSRNSGYIQKVLQRSLGKMRKELKTRAPDMEPAELADALLNEDSRPGQFLDANDRVDFQDR